MDSWRKWTSLKWCLPIVCTLLLFQAVWVAREERGRAAQLTATWNWAPEADSLWQDSIDFEFVRDPTLAGNKIAEKSMSARSATPASASVNTASGLKNRSQVPTSLSKPNLGEEAHSEDIAQPVAGSPAMDSDESKEILKTTPLALDSAESEGILKETPQAVDSAESKGIPKETSQAVDSAESKGILKETSQALNSADSKGILKETPQAVDSAESELMPKETSQIVDSAESKEINHDSQEGETKASERAAIPFYFYEESPKNSCDGIPSNSSLCSTCTSLEQIVNYLKEYQAAKQPEVFIISLDYLAHAANNSLNSSNINVSFLDNITKKREYLHFGGSDNILLCLRPGCAQIMQEITVRHPLGKDTRAMWVTLPSELEKGERDLWPCPDRVLAVPEVLAKVLASSFSQEKCPGIDEATLDAGLKELLSLASEKIKGGNRWKCSKERWNVDLSHLKNRPDQGCQEVARHQVCFTSIPKCGTSTMDVLVRRMNGSPLWNTSRGANHGGPGLNWSSALKHYDHYEKLYTSTSHIKILIVRNPEDRFFSAYMDKIYHLHEFGRIGMRAGAPLPTLDKVADHFYAVHTKGKMSVVDKHFRPMHTFASIGSIRYDFVVRVESMTEDLGIIFRSLGLYDDYLANGWGPHGNLSFADYHGKNVGHKPPPTVKYSPKSLKDVQSIYAKDYEAFDYTF